MLKRIQNLLTKHLRAAGKKRTPKKETPANKKASKELGKLGEELALRHLEKQGLRLLARNLRLKAGELDLVMLDCDTRVFVEVKTRLESKEARALLFENIDRRKKAKLLALARSYIGAEQRRLGGKLEYRIDLVGVIVERGPGGNARSIVWLKGAV